MPIKPLFFKGDKKPSKKRKHRDADPNTTDPTTSNPQLDDDDTWVTPSTSSDLSGPVLLILPTTPPTCLASDPSGNIFASRLENLIDDRPETAEPHDVRQVWVANKVAGLKEGELTFMAAHKDFLGCDSMGRLSASGKARGSEELFVVRDVEGQEGRRWRIETAYRREGGGEKGCISATTAAGATKEEADEDGGDAERAKPKKISVTLRGDAEATDSGVELIIKMQARFKPQVQQEKDTKAREKVSRTELERAVGRKLEDDEVRRLKRARKDGMYHEEVLDLRAKSKHDKWA